MGAQILDPQGSSQSRAAENVNANPPADKASGSHAKVTGNTKISSLEDLRKKAPKVWKQMMLGIAMNICNEMKKSQERIKKLMREARQDTHQTGGL